MARFSQTVDARDGQLRTLLTDANKVTAVLAERSDAIVTTPTDSNALLTDLTSQSRALDEISGSIAAMSRQIEGLITETRQTLKPVLDSSTNFSPSSSTARSGLPGSRASTRRIVLG